MSEYNKPEYNREFDKDSYGETMDSLNTVLGGLLLGQNMGGQIIENIEIPSDGSEIRISHNLKVVPKYRIILRQNGMIIDGDSVWTDKYIYLKASSGAFTKDIALNPGQLNTQSPLLDNKVCSAGEYTMSAIPSATARHVIEKECLNEAMSGSTGNTKVTILLMRG